MDIPLVSTAPTRATIPVAPITPTQVQAAGQAQTVALLVAQTTVDLSPLGRFLSAVSLFQKRVLELQSNPAAVAAEQALDDGASPLALATVDLAASANALQASSITGTSDDQSLATLFGQQFSAQGRLDGGTDDNDLAAIGLSFSSPSSLDDGNVLDVDTAVLQAAFATDPAGTSALLTRTATAFGALTGIAPAAIPDPAILFSDDPGPFDLQTQATPQVQAPQVQAQQVQAQQQDVPDAGTRPATPLSSDGAFLQELLAETPRPGLALAQAPPPEVAEAIANFEAQRVADADERAPARSALANSAAPLQPNPPPDETNDVANAAIGREGAQGAQSVQGAPQRPTLADTAAETAAGAFTTRGAAQPSAPATEQQPPLQAQAAAAQLARTQATQTLDAQDAARDANLRMADTIAAERAANERIANTMSAERAMMAAGRDTQEINEASLARATEESVEQQRLMRDGELIRLDQARTAKALEMDALELPALTPSPPASVISPSVTQTREPVDVAIPRPLPPPLNNAQQLARDPATAAAIAAYNLSAGPFAALNGRPEQGAPRTRVIAPVDSVAKVAAIETDAATSESAGRSDSAPGQPGGRA